MLYKEIRLVAHPSSIVFVTLGCLVIVPAYPYSVIFMFGCLASYVTFVNARETNDAWYSAILPKTKKDYVLGKILLVASFQVFQLLFSVPFVLLRTALNIPNNPVGLDPSIAWYGMGLILYAIFDFVFLTSFFKTGCKVGLSFIKAAIPMTILMLAIEACAHIPNLSWLDSFSPIDLFHQVPILAVGIIAYCTLLLFTYHICCKRFKNVDL